MMSMKFTRQYPEGYEEKCTRALDKALANVTAYQDWNESDIGGNDILARYTALPILNKEMMRKYGPAGFVPSELDFASALKKGEIEIVNTSGTTGDQVTNVWYQKWWDASEHSSWQLNNLSRTVCDGNHREAILASPLCVGFPDEESYLSKSQRRLGRFLFLNERVDPSKWTEAHMLRMHSELNEYAPAILEANPSYLAYLSRFINRHGLKSHKPELIVFTYENPSHLHLKQIARAFGVPMASSYGSTEAGYVFMQCECGYFHQNVEHCHVDFIPFSDKHGGSLTGSILVTTFENPWRSLLRFDIGDIVTLSDLPCPCGRDMGLTLKSIEGRAVNLTTTVSGLAVTQAKLDRAMAEIQGIAAYQFIQHGHGKYNISYVPEESMEMQNIETELLRILKPIYGINGEFSLSCVSELTPDPPGKYRLTKPLIDINPLEFWSKS